MAVHGLQKWSTVLAGAIACAAGSGVVASYAFGIYIKAIAEEFGWTRAETTFGMSAYYVAGGFGAIALGNVIARWGTRRAALAFTLLFSLALVLVAAVPRSVPMLTMLFAAMGFFSVAASIMPYSIAISGWFDRGRGTALALANTGTSVGGLFMPFYATWLLANYGWRGGYVGIGLCVGLLSGAALLLFYRDPPSRPRPAAMPERTSQWSAVTGDPAFWFIGIALLFISLAVIGMLTCLPPMLTDRGASTAEAGMTLGVLAGASVISRLGVGLMLDRIHIRYVATFIFVLVALGGALLIWGGSGTVWLAAACIGFGLGSEADLVSYAASRYFGARTLSKALGGIWMFFCWAGGLGVMAGSLSYDLTGSYLAALYLFTALAILSIPPILALGSYRTTDEEAGTDGAEASARGLHPAAEATG